MSSYYIDNRKYGIWIEMICFSPIIDFQIMTESLNYYLKMGQMLMPCTVKGERRYIWLVEMVKFLIKSPIYCIIWQKYVITLGYSKILNLLIKYGADVNYPNSKGGKTALYKATEHGKLHEIKHNLTFRINEGKRFLNI